MFLKWQYGYIFMSFFIVFLTSLCLPLLQASIISLIMAIGTMYLFNTYYAKSKVIYRSKNTLVIEQLKATKSYFTELMSIFTFTINTNSMEYEKIDYDALQIAINKMLSTHKLLCYTVNELTNTSIDICVMLKDLNKCLATINDLYDHLDQEGILQELNNLAHMSLMKIDLILTLLAPMEEAKARTME